VVEGPDEGLARPVPAQGLLVGTGDDCGMRLTDPRVSRHHLMVSPDPGGVRVRDLGSTNGTLVGGLRAYDTIVPPETRVALGRTSLELIGEAPLRSALRSFGAMVGQSAPMQEVFAILEQVVGSSATVLIEGDTGTGKELVAAALHTEGPRAGGPFVAIDCGAIAPELIEAELFGHVRGAFTGASTTRDGALERADGGVLFLDEVGELPLGLQPKLLRALETREVRKVGAERSTQVDFRLVSATNRHLDEMVAERTFREDLYYRLAVVHLELPSLRDRLDDLPLLVDKLLRGLGVPAPGPITGPSLDRLQAHHWPGNVRELRNVLSRAIACSGTTNVRFTDLSLHLGPRRRTLAQKEPDVGRLFHEAKQQAIDAFEVRYLRSLLESAEGNVSEAARRAGLNRKHLHELLKKHDLR
jgi:DNA-binding NtrC family response regulator